MARYSNLPHRHAVEPLSSKGSKIREYRATLPRSRFFFAAGDVILTAVVIYRCSGYAVTKYSQQRNTKNSTKHDGNCKRSACREMTIYIPSVGSILYCTGNIQYKC